MSSKPQPQNMMRYASLSTQWMGMLLLAVWAGHKLDNYTKWTVPVFVILFPLASILLSLYQLIKEVNKPKK